MTFTEKIKSIAEYLGCNDGGLVSEMKKVVVDFIGEDEIIPEKKQGTSFESNAENHFRKGVIVRNKFRATLREKLKDQ